MLALFACVCVGICGIVAAPMARAISAEAESLTTSGPTYTYTDKTASGGKAVTLAATGSRVTFTGKTVPLKGVNVRAKGAQCFGAPVMRVLVDGVAVATTTVNATTWTDYSVSADIRRGTHSIAVEFTNDYQFLCDRNLYVDTLTEVPVENAQAPPPASTAATATDAVGATGCDLNQYRADYYNNLTLAGSPAVSRCEYSVGGNWSGSPLGGVNADGFSVNYTGALSFPADADYTFSADTGNVSVRVWLDNQLVIDHSDTSTWGRFEEVRRVAAGRHTVQVAIANSSGLARESFSVSQNSLGAPSGNGNYFARNSIWNNPVPDDAVIDPHSSSWVSVLANNSAYSEISMNSTSWSIPVYRAAASVATKSIRITNSNKTIQIPFASNYRPSQDTDAAIVIVDQQSGCMYDLQGFDPTSMSAVASASYHAYTGSGGHTAGPSHAGGEFSRVAGLITPSDVAQGQIEHALRFAIPGGGDRFYYPGTRTDGTVTGGPPQGVRIRLDPSVDLSSYGLTPFQKMVATALQKYGAFNSDTASTFALYAEDPIDGSTFTTQPTALPKALISKMQFLKPTVSSTDISLDRSSDTTCAQQQ